MFVMVVNVSFGDLEMWRFKFMTLLYLLYVAGARFFLRRAGNKEGNFNSFDVALWLSTCIIMSHILL